MTEIGKTRGFSASPGVGSILADAFGIYRDSVAIEEPSGRTLTYGELGEHATSLASALYERGGSHGDRLLIILPNSAESLIIDCAAFISGLVRVALSVRLHPRELVEIVRHCEPRFIFADHARASDLVRVEESLAARLIICGETDGVRGATPYDEVQVGGPSVGFKPPAPSDLAALLYTSGTTGTPKGSMVSHAGWAAMMRNSMVELPPIDESDCVLHAAPLSHFSGYVAPTYLARGARHVILQGFNPQEVLRRITTDGVTTLPLVPTMLNDLIMLGEESGFSGAQSLRTILYGGSAIAPDRLRRGSALFGDVFIQFYGLSELPMPLTALSARDHARWKDEEPPVRLSSAGRPSPFVNLRVVTESGRVANCGELGEIVVRCDTMMMGYWNDASATAEMIGEEGWARTGDLGHVSEDGYVTIVDRKTDVIVSGGYNIYPIEVENAIARLTGVNEVAVVGVPDERLVEAVAACIVVRPGFTVVADDVIAACLERLARYKRPRHILFLDELPRTGSGKLRRRSLRDRFNDRREAQPELKIDAAAQRTK